MSVPFDVPVITPCQHLFCNECLREALSHQQLCPVDRCEVRRNQVTTLREGSLVRRIWAGIRVKCGNHIHGCAWVGQISDYKTHASNCAVINGSNSVCPHELQSLKDQNADLENQVKQRDAAMARFESKVLNHDPKALGLFCRFYDFGREDVVDLSKLICIRLENKPSYIDHNRIFNCVQNCFRDWERGYNDNPDNYSDMKMLLAICHACTWFTDRQHDKINEMLNKL